MGTRFEFEELIEDLKRYINFQKTLGIRGYYTKEQPATEHTPKGSQNTMEPKMTSTKTPDQPDIIQVEDQLGIFDESTKAMTLEEIREEIGDCTRCKLHTGRTKLVFGDGNPKARLVFVGEGPGRDEDLQGKPFVGRAGKLLTKIIEAMGLERSDVYICNVVKCRPPGNRTPEPDEMNTCEQFLFKQLRAISPEVIVCLGATASHSILKTKGRLGDLRGRFHKCAGAKLMVTYHPAALLRNPGFKKPLWDDMQVVIKELGLSPKGD